MLVKSNTVQWRYLTSGLGIQVLKVGTREVDLKSEKWMKLPRREGGERPTVMSQKREDETIQAIEKK